mgnify:CR=1 FL=1
MRQNLRESRHIFSRSRLLGSDSERAGPGSVSWKVNREMIVVAISAANQCQYCVVAHGAILRIRAKDPTISELVGANWRKADNVTPKQKAMLAFALKVAQEAHLVSEADRQALRGAGFGEEEIWDIAAIAAFFSMSNRLANATELRPNREFHAMGRG